MRLRLFLAMTAAVAVVAGLTALAYNGIDLASDGGDQVVSGSATTGSTTPEGDDADGALAPGEVRVSGTVTTVLIAGAVLDPREVPTPLTITSERGFGNGGELTTVEVDGEPASIVWDGGRPFELTSGGSLVLDPLNLALTPEGLRAVLGHGNHAFTPGTYRIDTPVAVGRAGIATPRDSVTFTAIEGSLFEGRGDAAILFPPEAPRHFIGPGKVVMGGTLEVTDLDGTRTATAVTTEAPSAFDLTFTPDGAGGWTVDGLVEQATAT